MKDAFQGKVPDKKHYHNPNIKDDEGNTIAMLLA